jgi:hypothetical protein
VTGEPAACERSLPDLAPGAATVHTCRVVVTRPVTLALAVSGIPALPGLPSTATITVRHASTVAPAPANRLPDSTSAPVAPPAPAPRHEVADDGPLRSPATPALIAVLGVLVMTVSLGGLSSATRRLG